MRTKIYLLERYEYYGFDKAEKENIEKCYILGYYDLKKELEKGIETCNRHGIKKDEIRVVPYTVNIRKGQKNIYILTYEYSLLNKNEEFIDYEYIFAPKRSRRKCVQMKKKLKRIKKYSYSDKKIYVSKSTEGYWISKYCLNKLYSVDTGRY